MHLLKAFRLSDGELEWIRNANEYVRASQRRGNDLTYRERQISIPVHEHCVESARRNGEDLDRTSRWREGTVQVNLAASYKGQSNYFRRSPVVLADFEC